MMSKKGIEMSVHTMVVIALSLIVILVLIFGFSKFSGTLFKSVNSCEEKGYSCSSQCDPETESFYSSGGCEEGEVCCAPKDSLKNQLGFGS